MQISRNSFTLLACAAASALILSACGGGSSTPAAQAALTVAAVSTVLDPSGTTTLSSSGGSGTGATTYNATGACTVSGTTVTAASTGGACSVTATKAADSTYSAITSSALTVTVRAPQAALTVAAASTSLSAGGTTNLSTTGGSGAGAVTYQVTAGGCTVSAAVLTAPAADASCSVTATKAADGSLYAQATSSNTLTVTVTVPSTTFLTFDETTPPVLEAFGGDVGTIETDPAGGTNKVMKVVKSAGNQTWAGVTMSKCSYPAFSLPVIPLTATNKKMSLRVYSTVANKVLRLKLENAANGAINVEMDATVTAANTWQTLTFDITQIANNGGAATRTWLATDVLNKASVFADFGNQTAITMYVDDLKFVGTASVAQTCLTAPVTPVAGVPSTAATTPTVASAKALSVYSDAYTAIPGVNLNPGWGQSTAQTQIQVESNNVLKHANLNYQGFDWANNAIDVSTYTNLHIDLWSADATSVKVFVISAGQDTQSFTVPITASTWVSQDIALSTFSMANKAAVIQVKLESVPFGGTTVYMDNLYFWKP